MKNTAKLRLILIVILFNGISNSPLLAQKHSDWKTDLLNLDFKAVPHDRIHSRDQFHNGYILVYKSFIEAMVCQTLDRHTSLSIEVDHIIEQGKKQRKSIRKDFKKTSSLAGAFLFRAVSAGQHGEYMNSAKDLYSAYKYYKDMLGMEPNHPTTKTYGGIMAILYGELPDEYYSWLSLLGIRMDSEDGFRQLKEVYYSEASSDRPDILESALILIVALKEFGDDPAAAWRFVNREGLEDHPNILIRYFSAMAAFRAGETGTAIALLEEMEDKGEGKKLPYVYYQKGRLRLYSEDPLARREFEDFLEYNCGYNYIKSTWQKLAWHHIMTGDKGRADKSFRQAVSDGESFMSADQQALRELENELVPVKEILRLRLLFDGKYYKKCLEECSTFEKKKYRGLSERQVVEVLYRQARSHEFMKSPDRAISYYRKIVENYPDVPTYQVPRAALQAGIMMDKSGRKTEAEEFLSLCLKYNKYGYKSTIRREAHAAKRGL